MATVSAPTNIACIKYWGKASVEYNTPTNDSVSVTLDQADLRAVTTAAASSRFPNDRLWLNGEEEEGAATNSRFRACVDEVRKLAAEPNKWQGMHVHISSYNTFPTAAGLASSAAGYAALVAALAALFDVKEQYPGQLSAIARQGSGSACRSMYGGFVAWRKGGNQPDWSDSIAQQVAPETHWPELRALICVVSDLKKDTSSTAGMTTSVETSELLQHRIQKVVPDRMDKIEQAFRNKDFETFGQLTMADSNQFHAVCLDTYPPIFYMNDISKSIIRIIHAYNSWAGQVRAAYTFDAGPNAVIYTLDEYAAEVGALLLQYYPKPPNASSPYISNTDFLQQVEALQLDETLVQAANKTGRQPKPGDVKMIYYTKSGPGPQTLSQEFSNLDPVTGLNTYTPKH